MNTEVVGGNILLNSSVLNSLGHHPLGMRDLPVKVLHREMQPHGLSQSGLFQDAIHFAGRGSDETLDKNSPSQNAFKYLIHLANRQPLKYLMAPATGTLDVFQAATIQLTAKNPDPFFREVAVKRAFFILNDQTRHKVLSAFLNDPHPAVISRVFRVVQSFSTDAAKKAFLTEAQKHPSLEVRQLVLRAVRYMARDRNKKALLSAGLKDQDPMVRFEAMNSCLTLKRSARIRELIIPMLQDQDPLLKQWAESILADYPPSRLMTLRQSILNRLRESYQRKPEDAQGKIDSQGNIQTTVSAETPVDVKASKWGTHT
jgi:hypothetical protein